MKAVIPVYVRIGRIVGKTFPVWSWGHDFRVEVRTCLMFLFACLCLLKQKYIIRSRSNVGWIGVYIPYEKKTKKQSIV